MRLLPEEPWTALLRRWLRRMAIAIGSVVVLAAATFLALRAFMYVEYRRTVDLNARLNALEIGDSKADVLPKIQSFQDNWNNENNWWKRNHPELDVSFLSVDPWHEIRPFHGPGWFDRFMRDLIADSYSIRQKLGLRSWVLQGAVQFSTGRLESLDTDLIVEGSNGWLGGSWRYDAVLPPAVERPSGWTSTRPCLSHWSALKFGNGFGTARLSYLIPSASFEQKRAVKRLNLDCISRSSPCGKTVDIAPDAHVCSEE